MRQLKAAWKQQKSSFTEKLNIFSIWVVFVSRNNTIFYGESIPKIFAGFALDKYISTFSAYILSHKASKILHTALRCRLWYLFLLKVMLPYIFYIQRPWLRSHELQDRTKSTNNLANTITMVAEPLIPPVVWIWWTHTTAGVGGLAHTFSKSTIKRFSWNW